MFRFIRVSNRLIKPRHLPTFSPFRTPSFNATNSLSIPLFQTRISIPNRLQHSAAEIPTSYNDDFCTLDYDEKNECWFGETKEEQVIYIQSKKSDDLSSLLSRVKAVYDNRNYFDQLAKDYMLTNQKNEEDILEWSNEDFSFDGVDIDSKEPDGNFKLIYSYVDLCDCGHGTVVAFKSGKPVNFYVDGQ